MNDLILKEIESQLSLDSELLYRIIGASQSIGATPGTARDGKVIIENAKRTLKERICTASNVQTVYKTSQNSKVQLAAAILDCIAGAVSGVSPITVAVLLTKEGINLLCEDFWNNAS